MGTRLYLWSLVLGVGGLIILALVLHNFLLQAITTGSETLSATQPGELVLEHDVYDEDEEKEPAVQLKTRAFALIELLSLAAETNEYVIWE